MALKRSGNIIYREGEAFTPTPIPDDYSLTVRITQAVQENPEMWEKEYTAPFKLSAIIGKFIKVSP